MSADAPTPLDLDAIRADLDARVPARDLEDRNHARGLLVEVERLRAELDQAAPHITYDKGYLDGAHAARPAPAWDEEAVTEAVRRAVAGVVVNASNWPDGAQAGMLGRDLSAPIDAITAAVLAVVLEHLPVKPDREDIYRAWRGTDDPWGGCADRASIERVLDLWPGESRATVQAEALRDAADEAEATDADALVAGCAAPVPGERGRQSVIDAARAMCEEPWTWLRDRADRLEKGADRG